MWYLIYAQDNENSLAARQLARPAHLQRLQLLCDEGRLMVAGPNPNIDAQDPGEAGFSGSTVIAQFNHLEEAQAWADSDPYLDAGVYKKVTVKPLKVVLP